MDTKLSVIILTRNEEKNIKDCIQSVSFADEILVIDDGSTDKTVEIAQKMGAKVYNRHLDNFAAQRNFGMSKAKGEWIFFIDADERVPHELQEEIKEKIALDSHTYYKIPRKNHIFGKYLAHTDWYPDYQHRLFRNGGAKWERSVHEQLRTGDTGEVLTRDLLHDNYSSINHFVTKNFGNYADYEVQVLLSSGYRFHWPDLVTKPVGEFLRRFFAAEGYKDGVHGLVASSLVSFAVFIVYAKVWEKQGFSEKKLSPSDIKSTFFKAGEDITYWIYHVSGGKNKLINYVRRIIT